MSNFEELQQDFTESLLQVDRIHTSEIFKSCYSDSGNFEMLEKLVIKSLEKIGVN